MKHGTWAGLALVMASASVLSSCGGSDEAATAHERRAATTTLLDDDADVMAPDPAAVPADAGARTRQGRYATRAQGEALALALRGGVIHVDLGCCGEAAADLAVMTAYGLQAAHDLPDDAPVLVQGDDLRLAASVVDRLVAGGYRRVWLVTL